MYAFSPSWSESPGHWHHILGAISLNDFMKEFLHSVAGVALCRGDNKGIPRMPCVICTARLRKSLPAPGSPPHCWFSGTHPHPGAINAGSLLCRGGGSGADLLWMVSSQRATPLSQQGKDQLPPLSHSMISSAHFTRPPVQTWALPGVQRRGDKVRLLFTSDPCRTQRHTLHTLRTAQVTWDAERLKPSSGPQKEISLVKTYIVTTMNTFFAFYVFMKWISSCRNLRCKINI